MEKNKDCWVLMKYEDPIAVCSTEADVQELFMDCVMDARYYGFCYSLLKCYLPVELALISNDSLDGYWYTKVLDWR